MKYRTSQNYDLIYELLDIYQTLFIFSDTCIFKKGSYTHTPELDYGVIRKTKDGNYEIAYAGKPWKHIGHWINIRYILRDISLTYLDPIRSFTDETVCSKPLLDEVPSSAKMAQSYLNQLNAIEPIIISGPDNDDPELFPEGEQPPQKHIELIKPDNATAKQQPVKKSTWKQPDEIPKIGLQVLVITTDHTPIAIPVLSVRQWKSMSIQKWAYITDLERL